MIHVLSQVGTGLQEKSHKSLEVRVASVTAFSSGAKAPQGHTMYSLHMSSAGLLQAGQFPGF